MDRLPTPDELKEFFKNNDWTTEKIDDPAKRTPEEQVEIEYTAKLMDEHFEKLVRQKGRTSKARFCGKDNPLIALQENTEDLSRVRSLRLLTITATQRPCSPLGIYKRQSEKHVNSRP